MGPYMSEKESESEKLPLSDFYKVVDSATIFKNKKWWEAIVVIQSNGKRMIAFYLWQFRDGKWKRQNKSQMRSLDEWNKVKAAADTLATKLQTETK